jgi:hypothetical protein
VAAVGGLVEEEFVKEKTLNYERVFLRDSFSSHVKPNDGTRV